MVYKSTCLVYLSKGAMDFAKAPGRRLPERFTAIPQSKQGRLGVSPRSTIERGVLRGVPSGKLT